MSNFWNFPVHPVAASTFADEVDILYFALIGLTIFFTLLVLVMLATFAFRYRVGSKASRKNPIHTSHTLELSWSIIPLILALFIFAWGAKLYADAYKIPENAMDIDVIGKQWMWHLEHRSSGIRENNELHIPIGQPIKLTMISQDVMHAFFIPEFRVQKFVNPGQYTSMWFTATKPGKYHIFCNQYCGTQHSLMGGYVYAMAPADFERWKAQAGYKGGDFDTVVQTQEEQGKELYESIGCVNCHNQNDNRRGPSLYGIYGTKRQLKSGDFVTADRDYLRRAIVNASDPKNLVAGYEPIMPDYSTLKEEQVIHLIAYIQSLGTAKEPRKTEAAQPTAAGQTHTGTVPAIQRTPDQVHDTAGRKAAPGTTTNPAEFPGKNQDRRNLTPAPPSGSAPDTNTGGARP